MSGDAVVMSGFGGYGQLSTGSVPVIPVLSGIYTPLTKTSAAGLIFTSSVTAGCITASNGSGSFTVTQPGIYHVDFSAAFTHAAAAARQWYVNITKNGSIRGTYAIAYVDQHAPTVSITDNLSVSNTDTLDVGGSTDDGGTQVHDHTLVAATVVGVVTSTVNGSVSGSVVSGSIIMRTTTSLAQNLALVSGDYITINVYVTSGSDSLTSLYFPNFGIHKVM
jgi:hypothetical protein